MLSIMRHQETMHSTLLLSPGENTSNTGETKTPKNIKIGIPTNSETWTYDNEKGIKWKTPFFCSKMRDHHRYLENEFYKPSDLADKMQVTHTYHWKRRVLTYISSQVLLFWRLSSSPPLSVSIFLQAYFLNRKHQTVTDIQDHDIPFDTTTILFSDVSMIKTSSSINCNLRNPLALVRVLTLWLNKKKKCLILTLERLFVLGFYSSKSQLRVEWPASLQEPSNNNDSRKFHFGAKKLQNFSKSQLRIFELTDCRHKWDTETQCKQTLALALSQGNADCIKTT